MPVASYSVSLILKPHVVADLGLWWFRRGTME